MEKKKNDMYETLTHLRVEFYHKGEYSFFLEIRQWLIFTLLSSINVLKII